MTIRIRPTVAGDPQADRGRVNGAARFTADVTGTQALHAAFVYSTQRHARIRSIDTSAARAVPGVIAVVTGADIGERRIGRRVSDYPILAFERVLCVGQRVAAVAAIDQDTARQAAELIDVDYEPLEVVEDPEQALRPDAPILHPDYDQYEGALSDRPHPNVQGLVEELDGKGREAFSEAETSYEHTFTWERSHAAPLEPHASLVAVGATEVHVYSSHKQPYLLQSQMAHVLGRPEEQVVVHHALIGGDFGAKGVAFTEGVCGVLSEITGRPVRTVMTYFEVLVSTGARHRGSMRLRTGLKDDRLYVHESETVLDGGGFTGFKPQPSQVISIAGITTHVYHPPHRAERAMTVYTNNLPGAQVRSPGEFQAIFAGESHVDMIARARGEDPLAFRLRCVTDPQARRVLEELEDTVAAWRAESGGSTGIGVAAFHRGSGSGSTRVACHATRDGVELAVGVPDQGAGAYAAFRRLASETLGVDAARVTVRPLGAAHDLTDKGAGSSRVTAVAGEACVDACRSLLAEIGPAPDGDGYWIAARLDELGREEVTAHGNREVTRKDADQGPVSHGAIAIEVSVDTETGSYRVHRACLVIDAGRIVNEVGFRGQIEGGFVYGLGQARFEELMVEDGQVVSASLGDYKLASASDVPPLDLRILPPPDGDDALRPIGELANLGVAPAIANAVDDAVGVRVTQIPITAERVWQALRATSRGV